MELENGAFQMAASMHGEIVDVESQGLDNTSMDLEDSLNFPTLSRDMFF